MLTRPTLNGLTPRTLDDAARDPFDNWQPPPLVSRRIDWEWICRAIFSVAVGVAMVLAVIYGPWE